ncbi:MAG: tRNA (N(6)-L-threonylcarbamoyladenosine(37)-C(2))-methylthiotransferase MtaB, partial [Candidatus Aminicenantes bacterium]|nr:tRNA (N(6)-L-threonylcarbamoyladenosine(37)-C(2))-methylthiotransferase MtaB [Candidatus Aminicenantes bacterium]
MDSFSIRNFGCRVNQAETFGWAHELQKRGLRHEEHVGRGGLVIVNTCTLTGRADRDARKFIRKVLRENPSAKVVVTGCLAERDPRAFETLPGIWMVLPNQDKDTLPERLLPGAA